MDTTDDILQLGETLLSTWAVQVVRSGESTANIYLERTNFKAAAQTLFHAGWGYLTAITGLDQPPVTSEDGSQSEGHIEVLYHFCRNAAVLNLRVSLPYSDPVIETICDLTASATLYERELMELFGVQITGTPNTARLVLPDDWPDGVYPLRKSFTGL